MKRTIFLFTLLLAVPAFTAGQTQTRDQKSNDNQTSRTGSTAVRDRVVGSTHTNHVETQKGTSPSSPESAANSSSPVNQKRAEPKWGNTTVVDRPGPNIQIAPRQNSATDKQTSVNKDTQSVRKLVQQTALVSEAPRSSPVANNAGSAKTLAARGSASTVVYQVGVGDVLDIRLSNLPTRESTLFTVLKNGVLEYPLLSGPLSVAGMTTDEIAKLLGNEIKVIKTARVSVSVRDYASHTVVVTGLVDSPGRKTMRREAMPLFAVLAEALPRPEASVATIVRDSNSQTVALSNQPAMSTLVLPGDVIKISGGNIPATRFVYVGGEVASRGEKEFRDGMTLTQAILSAGGVAAARKMSVKVARRKADGFLLTSEYSLQSIKDGKSQDPLLEAGDRIEVTRGL
ncbi:MAG TPA: polysaccharide biosynthesis/export family protein [Pyrinomonadaceae bacterium]|nr:polysaccharide biosynthesis/export family protein [Pyrinomonadaceae bacterium]